MEDSQALVDDSAKPVFSSVDLEDLDIYKVNERLVFPYSTWSYNLHLYVEYTEDIALAEQTHWRERVEENAPRRVFQCIAYPKTGIAWLMSFIWSIGGRLGNCYLLWGNELKHDYFPFVAIAGPDWKFNLILLIIPWIAFGCAVGSMHFYDNYGSLRMWICLLACLFEECILLVTGLSNPGIVFRGMQPPEEQGKIICSRMLTLFIIYRTL